MRGTLYTHKKTEIYFYRSRTQYMHTNTHHTPCMHSYHRHAPCLQMHNMFVMHMHEMQTCYSSGSDAFCSALSMQVFSIPHSLHTHIKHMHTCTHMLTDKRKCTKQQFGIQRAIITSTTNQSPSSSGGQSPWSCWCMGGGSGIGSLT